MQTLHLDQWVMIKLARAHFNKPCKTIEKELYRKIIAGVDSEKIIVPLSATHLLETRKVGNIDRRNRLAEFMSRISQGYALCPSYHVLQLEVENAVLEYLGRPKIPIIERILGIGLQYLIAQKPVVTSEDPSVTVDDIEIINKHLKSFNESHDFFYQLISYEGTADKHIPLYHSTEILEQIRDFDHQKYPDKDIRYEKYLRKNILTLLPFLAQSCTNNNEYVEEIIRSWSFDDWKEFFIRIPVFYSLIHLEYGTYRQYHRRIRQTDLYDIQSLSVAIPYSDIVICDREFGAIAKSMKLDKLFSARISNSLKSLNEIIE